MKPILTLQNIKKSFDKKTVLEHLNITVNKGETVALIGPNGAGKTTTIDLILGLLDKDQGTISLLNSSPKQYDNALYTQIGVQFQSSYYPEYITVDEICKMTSCLYKNPLPYKDLLKDFKLEDKTTQKVKSLSGGERQKLAVMLSLLNNPKIVFLDELTTGLDPQARRDVWDVLQTLQAKGTTILLTSHYMDEVERLCDRILILHNKNIVFNGTSNELKQHTKQKSLEEAYLSMIKEV